MDNKDISNKDDINQKMQDDRLNRIPQNGMQVNDKDAILKRIQNQQMQIRNMNLGMTNNRPGRSPQMSNITREPMGQFTNSRQPGVTQPQSQQQTSINNARQREAIRRRQLGSGGNVSQNPNNVNMVNNAINRVGVSPASMFGSKPPKEDTNNDDFKSVAELLWKEQPLKLIGCSFLEQIYKSLLDMKNMKLELSEKQNMVNIQKNKIIQDYDTEIRNLQVKYDTNIQELKSEKENAILTLNRSQLEVKDKLTEKLKKSYEESITKATKPFDDKIEYCNKIIEFIKKVIDNYEIDTNKYKVYVSRDEISVDMKPQSIMKLVKKYIDDINNTVTDNKCLKNVVNKIKNLGDKNSKFVGSGLVFISVVGMPVTLLSASFLAGKKGINERSINKIINKSYYGIMNCFLVTKILKDKLEKERVKNIPSEAAYIEDSKKAFNDLKKKFDNDNLELNKKYDTEIKNAKKYDINTDINNLKIKLEENCKNLDDNFNINEKIAIDTIKSGSLEIKNKLDNYISLQIKDKHFCSNDGDFKIDNAKEIILFKNIKKWSSMLDKYKERDLYRTLDLGLIPSKETVFEEIMVKLEYDWLLYDKLNKLETDVNKIAVDISNMSDFEVEEGANVETSVKKYIQNQIDKFKKDECELYMINTSNILIGESVLKKEYLNIYDDLGLISGIKSENVVFESKLSKFDNKSVLLLYKTEDEAVLLANFLKVFIYNLLSTYHTESCLVNVINPNGNSLFDDLQINRDYISDKAETKGVLIKGAGYVTAFLSKEDMGIYSQKLALQDKKTTRDLTKGGLYVDLIKERFNTGGIIPKYTINVLIDLGIENEFNRFLAGTDKKGVINIMIASRSEYMKLQLKEDTKTGMTSIIENVDMSTILTARKYNTIIEVLNVDNKDNRNILGVSYRDSYTKEKLLYKTKSQNELDFINNYLKERALVTGKNKLSNVTRDFINKAVTEPALKERLKYKEKLINIRKNLEEKNIYLPYLKKGQKESDLKQLSGDELEFAKYLLNKMEANLELKERVNPNCYWEGNCEKTLSLYFGYVEGDQTKAYPVILDEVSKPHIFIAGTTGGGKSNTLGVVVNTLKMMYSPADLEIFYFDFKVVEVALHASPYKMPHCSAMCGSSESAYLMSLLDFINNEMDRRYELFKILSVSKLSEVREVQKKQYNKIQDKIDRLEFNILNNKVDNIDESKKELQLLKKELSEIEITPRLLVLVDEAAQAFQCEDEDLKAKVKSVFIRLGKLARAAGIHLCLVSQDIETMPQALMDLIAVRGCTVAPQGNISKNVLGNDFCKRPENQFQGFFGINANGGNEDDNIQYVVPYNNPDDATKILSKVADALCKNLNIPSRDAVIFDDNNVYTNTCFYQFINEHKDLLDGYNIFLGEGVYFQKKFVPHRIRVRNEERSSLLIISSVTIISNRLLDLVLDNLYENAYIYPIYCKDIPEKFPVEYFNRGLNKEDGYVYRAYGSGIINQQELLDLREDFIADQVFIDDCFGKLEVDKLYGHNTSGDRVEFDEVALQELNKQSSWLEELRYRVDEATKMKSVGEDLGNPTYYVVFGLTKSKFVMNNGYMFWKDFTQLLNDASLVNIHVIFVDSNFNYLDRGIGGYILASNVDSIQDKPKEFRDINKNYVKIKDIMGIYSALVKLPRDLDESEIEHNNKVKNELDYKIENFEKTLLDCDREKYLIG